MNKCKYCGRILKDKSSIERGFGPVCGRKYADVPGQLSFEDILHKTYEHCTKITGTNLGKG